MLTESGFVSKLALAQSGHAQRARTMTGLTIEESEEARMHLGAGEWKIRVLADASRYQKIVSESQGEFDPGSG